MNVPAPEKWSESHFAHRLDVSGSVFALTFDDGPLPESTPVLLDALAQTGMRATFCVEGRYVAKHPELLRRIVAGGHEVANHSYTHPDFMSLTLAQAQSEITRTDDAIRAVLGHTTPYFRPPFGALSKEQGTWATQNGYQVLMWSADSRDWMKPAPGEVTKRILTEAQSGATVLAHESFPQSVREMPALLEQLKARGLRSVTVSELRAQERQSDNHPSVQEST